MLVTGFEPFGQWPVNSSWEAVSRLDRHGRDISVACLPVAHHAAAEALLDLIAFHRPETVLLTGLAGTPVPRLEMQARLGPDLREGAEPTRAGRWPFLAAQRTVQSIGAPCRLSSDAGRYVCETTYWTALATEVPQVAFLHLPPVSPQWSPQRLSRVVNGCLASSTQLRGRRD